jgi:hypothetical protein
VDLRASIFYQLQATLNIHASHLRRSVVCVAVVNHPVISSSNLNRVIIHQETPTPFKK